MNKQQYLESIKKEINTNKENLLKEVENEEMVPAMWSLSKLIDLKAQESVLKMFED